MAWQFAFLLIAHDPVRFRPMMVPAMVEKFTYGMAVVVLVMQGRTNQRDLIFAATDLTLGILFIVAFRKTTGSEAGYATVNR